MTRVLDRLAAASAALQRGAGHCIGVYHAWCSGVPNGDDSTPSRVYLGAFAVVVGGKIAALIAAIPVQRLIKSSSVSSAELSSEIAYRLRRAIAPPRVCVPSGVAVKVLFLCRRPSSWLNPAPERCDEQAASSGRRQSRLVQKSGGHIGGPTKLWAGLPQNLMALPLPWCCPVTVSPQFARRRPKPIRSARVSRPRGERCLNTRAAFRRTSNVRDAVNAVGSCWSACAATDPDETGSAAAAATGCSRRSTATTSRTRPPLLTLATHRTAKKARTPPDFCRQRDSLGVIARTIRGDQFG